MYMSFYFQNEATRAQNKINVASVLRVVTPGHITGTACTYTTSLQNASFLMYTCTCVHVYVQLHYSMLVFSYTHVHVQLHYSML